MSTFTVHTTESAPAGSRPSMARLKEAIGMVPNLAASMAESPALLEGFVNLREIQARGTFSPAEIQVLSLTNAVENRCTYCVALHSTLALKEGVPHDSVTLMRSGRSPIEPRLKALSDFSRTLVRERGRASDDDLRTFVAAGYTRAQALEVVLGVAVSILPNFAHHLTGCALDAPFEAQAWSDPRA